MLTLKERTLEIRKTIYTELSLHYFKFILDNPMEE
jgi:hypothetical protein